jgi:hypothetical protein
VAIIKKIYLAKFGYILDMKVGGRGKPNPSMFLATYLELIIKNLAIWIYFSLKFSEFGSFFFHEKSLVKWVEIIFLRSKFGETLLLVTSPPLASLARRLLIGRKVDW